MQPPPHIAQGLKSGPLSPRPWEPGTYPILTPLLMLLLRLIPTPQPPLTEQLKPRSCSLALLPPELRQRVIESSIVCPSCIPKGDPAQQRIDLASVLRIALTSRQLRSDVHGILGRSVRCLEHDDKPGPRSDDEDHMGEKPTGSSHLSPFREPCAHASASPCMFHGRYRDDSEYEEELREVEWLLEFVEEELRMDEGPQMTDDEVSSILKDALACVEGQDRVRTLESFNAALFREHEAKQSSLLEWLMQRVSSFADLLNGGVKTADWGGGPRVRRCSMMSPRASPDRF